MSLATKYRPQDFKDVVEQTTIVNILSGICKQPEIENRNFLLIGPAGTGKAQPLYSKVLTPNGFIDMKDVEVGTEVVTSLGMFARVSGIYPQGKQAIYEILLSDSTKIRVSDKHLNVVYTHDKDDERKDHVVTTLELLDLFLKSKSKIRVDIPFVDWPESAVSIDPYLLGVLIGCGQIRGNELRIECKNSNIVDTINNILKRDFDYQLIHLSKESRGIYLISPISRHTSNQMNPIVGILKRYCQDRLGLVLDKVQNLNLSLPNSYLCNSKYIRLELLNGILDTCGYINTSNSLSFAINNPMLSESIAFVVRSLGIRDNIKVVKNRFFDKYNEICTDVGMYNHTLAYDNLKSLVKLNETLKSRLPSEYSKTQRNIKSITYVGQEECKCIYVDNEDHTYISDGFIPTHNTTLARVMANVLNDGKANTIEIDAASHNGVDSVREIINQARMYPVGSKYKVFVIDECFSKGTLVTTPEGQKCIEDIKAGEYVLSKSGIKRVLNTFTNIVPVNRLLYLELTDGSHIVTTIDHKFLAYTASGPAWVEAKYLDKFNRLYSEDVDSNVYVKKSYVYMRNITDKLFFESFSEAELDTGFVPMYDLEVEDDHCYFVDNVLAHNCHSFSPQAWQIFLKPLEDAPAKSIFVFCTTNPEKIPATIISRVQTFQLSKISLKGIYNRLVHIIEEENKAGENISYTEDAVNYIAKLANGGMRDSISLLDKALAFTHDLTSESVAKALNLPEFNDYFKLLGAYAKKDNKTISEVIDNVYNSGVNFVKWFEGFHSFVMNVVKYIYLQDINLTMIPSHYKDKISKYGMAHCIICLKLANKLIKLNYELKSTQYLQETALTYLCQIPKKEG